MTYRGGLLGVVQVAKFSDERLALVIQLLQLIVVRHLLGKHGEENKMIIRISCPAPPLVSLALDELVSWDDVREWKRDANGTNGFFHTREREGERKEREGERRGRARLSPFPLFSPLAFLSSLLPSSLAPPHFWCQISSSLTHSRIQNVEEGKLKTRKKTSMNFSRIRQNNVSSTLPPFLPCSQDRTNKKKFRHRQTHV